MDNTIEIYSYGLVNNKDKVAIEYPEDMGRITIDRLTKHLENSGYEKQADDCGMLILSLPNSVFMKGALSNNMSRELEKVLDSIKAFLTKNSSRFDVQITSSDYVPEQEETEEES